MSDRIGCAAGPPWWVAFFNPIAKCLLGAGVPMLFNRLVTIRGRKRGLPRTTPVAVIKVSGRRWVWSPWGESHWVRNLRAARPGSAGDRPGSGLRPSARSQARPA